MHDSRLLCAMQVKQLHDARPSLNGHIKCCTSPSVSPTRASDFLETRKP